MISDVGINIHSRVRVEIEERTEINGDFQVMLIIIVCLVGLGRRGAWHVVLPILPTVTPFIGVVGTAVDAPVAWSVGLKCGLP